MKIIKKNNKDVFAFVANISLVLLEILGLIFLFTIPFKRFGGVTESADWKTFKYYTTDSNILMLISATISVIFMILMWKGKFKKMPLWVDIVKLTATATVTLTMFITVFFLTPVANYSKEFPVASLYKGSNLLYHLVCPIVSIVIFLLLENRKDIKLIKTLYCLIPTLVYGIFYLSMAYTHLAKDGSIARDYDWYGFCSFGNVATPFVIIGVLAIYYLFAWLLWLGNRKINIKSLA